MKKIVLALLCTVIGKTLVAQLVYFPDSQSASENIFNSPLPSTVRSRFDFILPNNNRMVIDIVNIDQLNKLPNLDSLFKKVWADLQSLRDSLLDPLMVRRVDYVASGNDNKIRIKKYPPGATYFSYKDDELVQMKVDQDTLRFKGYTVLGKTIMFNQEKIHRGFDYVIMLLLNNISDVAKLPDGILESGLNLLKKDAEKTLNSSPKKQNRSYYYALYNLQQQKKISPFSIDYRGYGKRHGFQPYIQVGIQYGRGAWIPSTGAGLEYYYGKSRYGQYSFRLMWEPYFFFQRDNTNKLSTGRNDFITFKYHNNINYSNQRVQYNENFSFGYLVRRKGDWFEPATFKFTLPGLQTRNVLLEPEFFFNKFFKNFSPSLKLTLYFE